MDGCLLCPTGAAAARTLSSPPCSPASGAMRMSGGSGSLSSPASPLGRCGGAARKYLVSSSSPSSPSRSPLAIRRTLAPLKNHRLTPRTSRGDAATPAPVHIDTLLDAFPVQSPASALATEIDAHFNLLSARRGTAARRQAPLDNSTESPALDLTCLATLEADLGRGGASKEAPLPHWRRRPELAELAAPAGATRRPWGRSSSFTAAPISAPISAAPAARLDAGPVSAGAVDAPLRRRTPLDPAGLPRPCKLRRFSTAAGPAGLARPAAPPGPSGSLPQARATPLFGPPAADDPDGLGEFFGDDAPAENRCEPQFLDTWTVNHASRIGHGETCLLPVVETGKDAIRRIDGRTLVALLEGKYADQIDAFHVIDCRFPYEFRGGHVRGAINVNSAAEIEHAYLRQPPPGRRHVLVFHCEFSSHRAPRMALHLRNEDRNLNVARYPELYYPEIYVLKGGYREFYAQHRQHCDPVAYVEMNDPAYRDELKRAMAGYKRVFQKSKSCQDVMFGRK